MAEGTIEEFETVGVSMTEVASVLSFYKGPSVSNLVIASGGSLIGAW